MPQVRIELSTGARRAHEKLYRSDRGLFDRVDRALDRLAEEPLAGKALHGPLAGRRSLRVGPVRIVYRFETERLFVFVLDVAQRGQAYR